MRTPLIVLVALLILVCSCQKARPEFHKLNLKVWRSDPKGCKGKRETMLPQLNEELEKLIGLEETVVTTLLGKPDETELYSRNQKFFRYYISPGPECRKQSNTSQKLVIRFNAVGLSKVVEVE